MMTITSEMVMERAKEICLREEPRIDPDFQAIVGWDEWGTIRESNWKLFEDEARAELEEELTHVQPQP